MPCSLPREVWDLIFQYLSQRTYLASISLVCRDFDYIIRSNRLLARKLMKAVRFAKEHGSGVDVVDDGEAAVCKTSRTGYPHIFSHTAWVTYEADATGSARSDHRPPPQRQQLYIAHFSIDEEPSVYFSISLSMVRTAVARVDCPLHFMISYFGDGDLHAYGSRANYRESNRDEARFKKGDVISVQIGFYDAYKAHQTYKFTPKPEQWRRFVEAKNMRARIYDQSLASRDRFPSYPYVIFFKNYKMVHDPIVFPDVEQWPVFVGAFLTKQGEKVTLVTPSPDDQFAPVHPYPPDQKSREEDERALREREAREQRELERWQDSHRWTSRGRSHSDERERRKAQSSDSTTSAKTKINADKERPTTAPSTPKDKHHHHHHQKEEKKEMDKDATTSHHHPHLSLRYWRNKAGLH